MHLNTDRGSRLYSIWVTLQDFSIFVEKACHQASLLSKSTHLSLPYSTPWSVCPCLPPASFHPPTPSNQPPICLFQSSSTPTPTLSPKATPSLPSSLPNGMSMHVLQYRGGLYHCACGGWVAAGRSAAEREGGREKEAGTIFSCSNPCPVSVYWCSLHIQYRNFISIHNFEIDVLWIRDTIDWM